MIMSPLSNAVSIFAVVDLVSLFSPPQDTFSEVNRTLCNVASTCRITPDAYQ